MFFVAIGGQMSPGVAAGTALVFFASPLIAGLLFWASNQRNAEPSGA